MGLSLHVRLLIQEILVFLTLHVVRSHPVVLRAQLVQSLHVVLQDLMGLVSLDNNMQMRVKLLMENRTLYHRYCIFSEI